MKKTGLPDERKTKVKISTNVRGAEKRLKEIRKLFKEREGGVSADKLKDIFSAVKSNIEGIKQNFKRIKELYDKISHPVTGRVEWVDLDTIDDRLNDIIIGLEIFADEDDAFLEKIEFNKYVKEIASELKRIQEYIERKQR